jgi:hypothetical protein
MPGEQWTNEQWYAWARQQIEIERRWLEQLYYEEMRRRRALWLAQNRWQNKMNHGDNYSDNEKREAAWSGLMDLVIGLPFRLIAQLFGG